MANGCARACSDRRRLSGALARARPRCVVWLGFAVWLGCSSANPEPSSASNADTARLLRSDGGELAAERLHGDVSLAGLPLGDVVIDLCPGATPGEATVESRIQPAALLRAVRRLGGRVHTLLSTADRLPRETQVEIYDGDQTRSYRLSYRRGGFDYEYRKTGDEQPRRGARDMPVDAPINDLHSAMLLLRAWRPRLGEQVHFYVALGRNSWRVDAHSVGPEMIVARGVPTLTHRIDGEAQRTSGQGDSDAGESRRSFSLWFGEGPEALPEQLVASANYGDVAMTLQRREASAAACRPAAGGE